MRYLFFSKTKKRSFIVILSALLMFFVGLVFLFVPIKVNCSTADANISDHWSSYQAASYYDSGSGTEEDPYLISTPEQLAKLSATYNAGNISSKKYYKLAKNINLSKHYWISIGTETYPFSGVIDGGNHAITGLIQNDERYISGLIGYAREVDVKNLILGVKIKNNSELNDAAVGGLIGIVNAPNNTIRFSNLHVIGTIESMSYSPSKRNSLGSLIGSVLACKTGSIAQDISVDTILKAENREVGTTINPLIGYIQDTNLNLAVNNCFAKCSIKIGNATNEYKLYEGNFGGSETNSLFTFDNRLNAGIPIFKNQYWITSLNPEDYNKTGVEIVSQLTNLGFSTGLVTTTTILTLTKNSPIHGNYTTISSTGVDSTYGIISAVYGELITVDPTPDTGYSFSSITVNSETLYGVTSFAMPNQHSTLSVNFAPNKYTLTITKGNGISTIYYKVNGASSFTSTATSKNVQVDYASTWYAYATPSEGYYYQYNSSSSVLSGVMSTSGATFNPVGTLESYTIAFDSNGGDPCNSVTANYGASITLPSPTKTGYTFAGWWSSETSNQGSGTQRTWSTMPDVGNNGSSVTLYAKWSAKNYTLTVDPNGGSWNSSTSSQNFTQAYETTKTIADPTRTGYTFKGWVIYKNVYSADWVEILYHYNENGTILFSDENDAKTARTAKKFSMLSEMAKFKYDNKYEFLLEYDVLTGYNRWTQTSDPTTSSSVSGYSAVNVSWTAKAWGGIALSSTATNTFIDGSPSDGTWWYAIGSYKTHTAGGKIGVPATNDISENGGQRLWVKAADSSLANLDGITTDCLDSNNRYYFSPQNVMIKAVWAPNVYKVTLDNQGATTAGTTGYYYKYNTITPSSSVVGNEIYFYTDSACTTPMGADSYTITKPTKTGYTFAGYFTQTDGNGTQYVTDSGGCINNIWNSVAGNTTLYAYWLPVAKLYYAGSDLKYFTGSSNLDTKVKINWNQDFMISFRFKVASAQSGKRILLVGNFDSGATTLNIEVNSGAVNTNKIRVYLHQGAGNDDSYSSNSIALDEEISVMFKYAKSSGAWNLTARGATTNITMSGTTATSTATATKTLKYGCNDNRATSEFNPVYISDPVISSTGVAEATYTKTYGTLASALRSEMFEYWSLLPNGYTALQYIQFSGSQYLNTNVLGWSTWEFDMQWTVTGTRQLLGYGGSGSEYWGVQTDGYYGLASWALSSVQAGNRDIIKHVYTESECGIYVNGIKALGVGRTDVTSMEYKFGNLANGGGYGCTFKLYSAKCMQNGKYVRWYIPCKNASGTVGLFDMVNGKFYTTESGSFAQTATVTTDRITASSTVAIPEAHTLYAHLKPIYKVTLNNQSATSAGTTAYYYIYNTKVADSSLTGGDGYKYFYTDQYCTTPLGANSYTITKPTRTGYTFGGYFTGTNGSGMQYVGADGGCINNIWSSVAANTTLYAKWTLNKYTLTLTKGTGISTIYYKINGATSWSSTTSSTTVQVNYGSTWYAYATAASGYSYTAYTSSSPRSGTMGTGGATYAPSGTAIYSISLIQSSTFAQGVTASLSATSVTAGSVVTLTYSITSGIVFQTKLYVKIYINGVFSSSVGCTTRVSGNRYINTLSEHTYSFTVQENTSVEIVVNAYSGEHA